MTDGRLSRAVVVYIWGDPRSTPYPSEHPSDLARVFGDGALDLAPYVQAILLEVYAEPMALPGEDVKASTDRIEAVIESRHPELDAAALSALGSHFAFSTK